MGVEKLTVIEGPMAGVEQNPGALESTGDWMRSHGVSPMAVGLGALAGAAMTRGDMLSGAAKWALLAGIGSAFWNRCAR